MKKEIYVSTDIEADGPIPGVYSMLSFGSAAFLPDKTIVSTFSANLDFLPGAKRDMDTMKWWRSQPDAWKACRENVQPPAKAMKEYCKWIKSLPGSPVFVAYPAGVDFTFIYWYLMKFCKESPFSFSALDIKTYAMAILKKDFNFIRKKNMPQRWFDCCNKSHVALDDAIEQGLLFCNMLKDNLGSKHGA